VTGGGNYGIGSIATVRATPDIGWRFVRWTENGVVVSTQAIYNFTVSTARVLTAEFARATYVINTTVNPVNGGTVDGDGTYLAYLTATLTANPAAGYRFVNWKENNVIVATTPTYVFVVDSSRTLVAHFTVSNAVQSLGDNNNISVFPNPTNGRFTLSLQRNTGPLSIKVQNVLGQTVLTTTMPAGTTEQRFDLTETGLYLITLTNAEGQKATVKVTVR
jgi:Divergent InlB B-repeat domain/Secretion system C-terminal sorting domain